MNAVTHAPITDGQRPFTGWMTLASLLAFFGVTFAANGALIYYALSTFSGEVDPSPYEHGVAYDRDIAAARAQDALGWRVTIVAARPLPDAPATFSVDMQDASGRPIEALSVSAKLEFAADMSFDRQLTLSEIAPGQYRGEIAARPGHWEFVLEAKQNGETRFRSRNQIDLAK